MPFCTAGAPKNPNRNMSGVPEWSEAEVNEVMRLYVQRGRLPKWKPIADELGHLNRDGSLNPALLHKGLVRSNNAVMNKVKEILYKEQGDTMDRARVRDVLTTASGSQLSCLNASHFQFTHLVHVL
jgi:hypothetical protein